MTKKDRKEDMFHQGQKLIKKLTIVNAFRQLASTTLLVGFSVIQLTMDLQSTKTMPLIYISKTKNVFPFFLGGGTQRPFISSRKKYRAAKRSLKGPTTYSVNRGKLQ